MTATMPEFRSPSASKPAGEPRADAFRQPLNGADRLMLIAHDALRRIGHPGFGCQTHVWLARCPDLDELTAALGRLARRYPVMSGILAREAAGPVWMSDGSRDVSFTSTDLSSDRDRDAIEAAENLFAEPWDLSTTPPVSFYLLRLRDGRALLIVRFAHALMDGKSPELLLAALDDAFNAERFDSTPLPVGDELGGYFGRFDVRRLRSAAMASVRDHLRWPRPTVMPAGSDERAWRFEPLRITVRTLSGDATAALTGRVKRLCGFANLCPAVVASVFRVIARRYPDRPRRGRLWTDIPLNLRLPRDREPIFRNFMSFVSLSALPGELGDRDALTRRFNGAMRDQLRSSTDLGNLVMMDQFSRRPRLWSYMLVRQMRKAPPTLGFGYLGPVFGGRQTLLGIDVTRMYTLNATMSPPGITLQVNQFNNRLNLAMTHIEPVVSKADAEAMLAEIEGDLIA